MKWLTVSESTKLNNESLQLLYRECFRAAYRQTQERMMHICHLIVFSIRSPVTCKCATGDLFHDVHVHTWPFYGNRMSYSWDRPNCLHSEQWSPTCKADTQQVGGEHTVQTLTLYSLHWISSVTGKRSGSKSYTCTQRLTAAYTFAVMLLNKLLKKAASILIRFSYFVNVSLCRVH